MEDPNQLETGLINLKKSYNKLVNYGKRFKNKIGDLKKIENRKSALISLMLLSIVALSITGYKAIQIRLKAFDIYLGEEKLGVVRDKEEVLSLMRSIEEEIADTHGMDVVLNKDIRFEQTKAKDESITHIDELEGEIKSKIGFLVNGYAIKVNGTEIGALKTKEEIEKVIDKIKQPYKDTYKENGQLKEVKVIEDMKIEKKQIPLYKIGKEDDLLNHLLTSSEEIKTHTIEVGESFWTIAKIYDVSVDELIEANPDKNPEKIQIGDEIKLVVPKPVLTVKTVAEVEYMENINYETEIEYNDNMYKNEKKIKVEGASGEKKILASEVKHNGVLVEKEIVKEEILKEPTTEVIIKGTKDVPKTIATGAFLMPTRGRISSRYGMRNGRMHRGLDIANKSGTTIKAADGGKVVYAGYKGAFGNLVEIDHGNGYRTRYAHCSKILVKVGDKVYKGQPIANVGNTGRSTGSHLHFEVLKNGRNNNPSNYVK